MAIRFASYLKRNRFGIFYFRRVVPPDLQPHFAFRQIARSLHTSNCHEARSTALVYSAAIDLLFSHLRQHAGDGCGLVMASKPLRTDLIVRLDFEADGTLKSVFADAKPEEAQAAERIVPSLLRAAREPIAGGATKAANPASPRLYEEIDKYIAEGKAIWTTQSALDIEGDFDQFK